MVGSSRSHVLSRSIIRFPHIMLIHEMTSTIADAMDITYSSPIIFVEASLVQGDPFNSQS
jgi:hypothetical protein